MCEVLGLTKVLCKLKAVKEAEDFNVDALAEELDLNLKRLCNQSGVEEEQKNFDDLRKKLEQAKKDLSQMDDDLVTQELMLDEMRAAQHLIMRHVFFLAEMEKKAGIASETMNKLREAYRAHRLSESVAFGIAAFADICTLNLGQFRCRQEKKTQLAQEDFEEFKANFTEKYGEVDSEQFATKKAELESEMQKKESHIKAGEARKNLLMQDREMKQKDRDEKKVELIEARKRLTEKLESVDAASAGQYKKVCDASIQFDHQRSRRGAFQMFASQAIKSIEAYHHFVGNLARADWDTQKKTMEKIVSSECGWGAVAPSLAYMQKICSPLGLVMTGDPGKRSGNSQVGVAGVSFDQARQCNRGPFSKWSAAQDGRPTVE